VKATHSGWALAGPVAIIGGVAKRVTDRDRAKVERTIRDRETLGHLGGRVRLLREQRGLSQEKLAERAGLTSKFLGEVERVETNPSTTSVARLAAALSVNVGDLFEAGDHLLPVPATQLDQVQESYRSLGLAIEGLRSPDGVGPNGGGAAAAGRAPAAPMARLKARQRKR
jgi:transcriptional regulator with XRE-family HTH domain